MFQKSRVIQHDKIELLDDTNFDNAFLQEYTPR